MILALEFIAIYLFSSLLISYILNTINNTFYNLIFYVFYSLFEYVYFQYFATLLIWIIDNVKLKDIKPDLAEQILVHIDDFVLAANTKPECELLEKIFDDLLSELNVEISKHKSVSACQQAELYGIWWDLEQQTLSIP